MPDSVGNRTIIACFCLAVLLAVAAPGQLVRALGNAQLWPEQDDDSPQHVYSILESEVTLMGFHCGVINSPPSTVFTADPDYRETPVTVGVQFQLEEVSALHASAPRGRMDDASTAETRTPLSARISRMLTQHEIYVPAGDGEMEDIFVPEASMGVADLVALCTP